MLARKLVGAIAEALGRISSSCRIGAKASVLGNGPTIPRGYTSQFIQEQTGRYKAKVGVPAGYVVLRNRNGGRAARGVCPADGAVVIEDRANAQQRIRPAD